MQQTLPVHPVDLEPLRLGDATNDRWTSTLHRVFLPPADVSGPVRRRSLARFLDGELQRTVSCIPSCSDVQPEWYPPVRAGAWLEAKISRARTMATADLSTADVSTADVSTADVST